MITVAKWCFFVFSFVLVLQLGAYNAILGTAAGIVMSGAGWVALLDHRHMRLCSAIGCLDEVIVADDTAPQDRDAARRMRDLLNEKL